MCHPGLLFGDDGVMQEHAEPCPVWNVYQPRDKRKYIQWCTVSMSTSYKEARSSLVSRLATNVDQEQHLVKAVVHCFQQPEKVRLAQLTRIDKWGRRHMQASLVVQVRKVNNVHTIAQQDNMMIAPLHQSWQITQMFFDAVYLIIHNLTLVDLIVMQVMTWWLMMLGSYPTTYKGGDHISRGQCHSSWKFTSGLYPGLTQLLASGSTLKPIELQTHIYHTTHVEDHHHE